MVDFASVYSYAIDMENAMTLLIEVRNVYGNETLYPANPAAATFAKIAGTKTLKSETLKLAKSLGYTVQVVPNRSEVTAVAEWAC